MVKCLGERGTHVLVTAEAEGGLLYLQKIGLTGGRMHAMATQAPYPSLRML